MRYDTFINQTKNRPLIEAEALLAGSSDPRAIRVSLSRWVKSGRLLQLRRGLYLLPDQFRKEEVSEFYIASVLKKPSYISLEKALEYYGLIPESVPVFTSVTTKRPGKFMTAVGVFDYHHLRNNLFWGYQPTKQIRQTFYMAGPEKAVLDFMYLKRVRITEDYLAEMRWQNTERLNVQKLVKYADLFQTPLVSEAARLFGRVYLAKKTRKPR